MDAAIEVEKQTRRPRFRRASEPPAFRLTDDDIEIVRQVARHRFIASGEIAVLVNRSIDRTNDRLMRLYHAGYVDRPRAQLDRFPTNGSGRIIYALADRGARLLVTSAEFSATHIEWSRKNREAGRPFIEHQIKIVEFQVALERAVRARGDVQIIDTDEILAHAPDETRTTRNPFGLRARLSERGELREIGVVPDLVFGLRFDDGTRRCFMVEIDRGTMPISRASFDQTSFERKMRVYLTAYAARLHERQLGWRTFRVLTITTDQQRAQSMIKVLRSLRVAGSPGSSLFLFQTFDELCASNPLEQLWRVGDGRSVPLT
jgi:hypothetical protein